MSNEVIFFGFLLLNLTLPILFLKGGKAWLYAYIGINGCLLIPMAPLTTSIFGYVISVTTIAWAPLYLITDILTERYGKRAAIGGAFLAAATGFIVIAIVQTALLFTPDVGSAEWHTNLQNMYQYSIRMVLVGATVFMLAQLLDIYIYDYIHKRTGEKYLWLRNNASTIFTTLFNNIMFWGLAFGDIIDNWLITALASYVLTVIVALCDTPFIYLAKKIKPLDLKK